MERIRLVILGDSITVGCAETGVTPQTTYPKLLKSQLEFARLEIDLIVSALHGVYTDYAVRRFNRMVRRHAPGYVLILLGSNDAGSTKTRPTISPHNFQTGLSSIIKLCFQCNAIPIVVSPLPRSDILCEFSMKQYSDASRTVAQNFGVEFVDLFGIFSDVGSLTDLLPDGLHPSPLGNQVIAGVLSERIILLFQDLRLGHQIRGSSFSEA